MFRVYYVWKNRMEWKDAESYDVLMYIVKELTHKGAIIKMIRDPNGEKI